MDALTQRTLPDHHEGRARILIVDDDASVRRVLETGLSEAGYECQSVPDADWAAELLSKKDFAIVLLDVVMPGKSGLEFLLQIREEYPDMAVIIVTGVGNISVAVWAMREGAYYYYTKPISLPELFLRIEETDCRRSLMLEDKAYQDVLEEIADDWDALVDEHGLFDEDGPSRFGAKRLKGMTGNLLRRLHNMLIMNPE